MSRRQLRKHFGNTSQAPPSDGSDDEYEPLYVRNASKSAYEGLVISSSEEEECVPEPDEPSHGESNKRNKRRKPKRRNFAKEKDELDEIDRSIMEINLLLGEPEPVPTPPPPQEPNPFNKIFSVTYRYLNVGNEEFMVLRNDPEALGRRRRRPQDLIKFRYAIVPIEFNFRKNGLSMSMKRADDGLIYFTYDHSREYQRMHKEFLENLFHWSEWNMSPVERCYDTMHVEGLIEASDLLFRTDNVDSACDLLEKVVAYLQYCAHPLFNITDMNIRLEYKVSENRPFFIVLLKYIYTLSNMACHRSALELAKMLMKLDPSDPLAIVYIIDTLAIRSRQYQWLVDAIDYLDKERNVGYLFNVKYSYALAHFWLAYRKKEDLRASDDILQEAILAFPWVIKEILGPNVGSRSKINEHELFSAYGNTTSCANLRRLTKLYAALIDSWWTNKDVVQWVTRNVDVVTNRYDNDPNLKVELKQMDDIRTSIFANMPNELIRHLHTIKYMSNFISEGAVPQMANTYSFDPQPPRDTISRYDYSRHSTRAYLQLSFNEALFELYYSDLALNLEFLDEPGERDVFEMDEDEFSYPDSANEDGVDMGVAVYGVQQQQLNEEHGSDEENIEDNIEINENDENDENDANDENYENYENDESDECDESDENDVNDENYGNYGIGVNDENSGDDDNDQESIENSDDEQDADNESNGDDGDGENSDSEQATDDKNTNYDEQDTDNDVDEMCDEEQDIDNEESLLDNQEDSDEDVDEREWEREGVINARDARLIKKVIANNQHLRFLINCDDLLFSEDDTDLSSMESAEEFFRQEMLQALYEVNQDIMLDLD